MSVDVVVIGCGAAGLSAAVSAAEGGRTWRPRPRPRPCWPLTWATAPMTRATAPGGAPRGRSRENLDDCLGARCFHAELIHAHRCFVRLPCAIQVQSALVLAQVGQGEVLSAPEVQNESISPAIGRHEPDAEIHRPIGTHRL
jgi:FAD binding domain